MHKRINGSLICAVAASAVIVTSAVLAHPDPQPLDGTPNQPGIDWTLNVTDNGETSVYQTPTSVFSTPSKPFDTAHPSNLLPTLYVPLVDSGGNVMPNTLPSTAAHPYNLHPDPTVSVIDPRSPRWDLGIIIAKLKQAAFPAVQQSLEQTFFANGEGVPADPRRGRINSARGPGVGEISGASATGIPWDQVQFAIDILEGNPVPRTYSGMALLHYKGPDMVKQIDPVTKTVTVHQSWQHARIMSDTMFIDTSTISPDSTWTIHYVIDDLFWGEEDFAPFATFWDNPDVVGKRRANVGFDQSFFPMEPGHRYIFDIKMPPAKYWNLTYHWGWRQHAPRIQAIENATKGVAGKNIVQWERDVFGNDPAGSNSAKYNAIAMLSDLAPAKRMWLAFHAMKLVQSGDLPMADLQPLITEAAAAYNDWNHRLSMPRGLQFADGYDETIAYLNNQMYGGMREMRNRMIQPVWEEWETRGATLHVKLLNGDYFPHLYMNVDFGGRRGWENIYQNTIPLGGQGPLFTFGRAYFFPNLIKPAQTPAADRNLELAMRHSPILNAVEPTVMHDLGVDTPHTRPAVYMADPTERATVAAETDSDPMTPVGDELATVPPGLFRNPVGLGEHNVIITFRFDPSRRLRFYQFDPSHHNEDILSVH